MVKAENRDIEVTEAGSYLRLIDSCRTQLQAQGPSRTCNESKIEEEEGNGLFLSGSRPIGTVSFRKEEQGYLKTNIQTPMAQGRSTAIHLDDVVDSDQ